VVVSSARLVARSMISEPCLSEAQGGGAGGVVAPGRKPDGYARLKSNGRWMTPDSKLLQGRPLHTEPAAVPDAVWMNRPRLNGHAAGIGWATGRACVINCECEMARVAPGDVSGYKSRGPGAESSADPRGGCCHRARRQHVAHGVARAWSAEFQWSWECWMPPCASERATVAVDGVAGVVRWMN